MDVKLDQDTRLRLQNAKRKKRNDRSVRQLTNQEQLTLLCKAFVKLAKADITLFGGTLNAFLQTYQRLLPEIEALQDQYKLLQQHMVQAQDAAHWASTEGTSPLAAPVICKELGINIQQAIQSIWNTTRVKNDVLAILIPEKEGTCPFCRGHIVAQWPPIRR